MTPLPIDSIRETEDHSGRTHEFDGLRFRLAKLVPRTVKGMRICPG